MARQRSLAPCLVSAMAMAREPLWPDTPNRLKFDSANFVDCIMSPSHSGLRGLSRDLEASKCAPFMTERPGGASGEDERRGESEPRVGRLEKMPVVPGSLGQAGILAVRFARKQCPFRAGKSLFPLTDADETRKPRLAGGASGIRTYGTLFQNWPLKSR